MILLKKKSAKNTLLYLKMPRTEKKMKKIIRK